MATYKLAVNFIKCRKFEITKGILFFLKKNKMKKQTRVQSALESIAQTIVGLAISFGIQVILYPLLKIPVTFEQNILITSVFFCSSLIRQYFIRRFFNKCKK